MRKGGVSRFVTAVGLLLALAGGASRVAAHSGHVVARSERYLKLDVGENGARLVVSLSLGAEEFLRISRRADSDHDGEVSRREADAFLGTFLDDVRRELPARLDGHFTRVDWGEPFMDPIGVIRAQPGTVEVVGRVRVPPGQHTLWVTDEMRQETIERTDVAFQVRDRVRLVASGPTDLPTSIVRTLAFGKDAPTRRAHSLAITVDVPMPPEGELPRPRPVGALGITLLIFAWSFIAVAISRLLRERAALAKASKKPRPI